MSPTWLFASHKQEISSDRHTHNTVYTKHNLSSAQKLPQINLQFPPQHFGVGVIGLGVTLLVQSREVAGSIPAGSTFLHFFFAFFFA
jgi:hypothetical protein